MFKLNVKSKWNSR